jgi:hypothetical protein
MTRSVSALVSDALACIARECPEAYARMRDALGPRRIVLAIGGEVVPVELSAAASPRAIAVHTSVDALCAVLAGELPVLDAVLARRLDALADPDDLIAASEAMTWFLHGAATCPSIEPLTQQLFALRTGGV